MRYWRLAAVVTGSLFCFAPVAAQRTSISTPTADTLRQARDQAHVGPAALGVIAAGVGLQLAGFNRRSTNASPAKRYDRGRFLDLGRTDTSVVSLKPRRPPANGRKRSAPIDPAVMAAAGYANIAVVSPPDRLSIAP